MSRKIFTIFEHHQQPMVSKSIFLRRVVKCVCVASLLLTVTIFMGAAVYHYVEGLSWVDAVMNAVMIMTGLVLAIIFAPLIHRFLHGFHLEIGHGDGNG